MRKKYYFYPLIAYFYYFMIKALAWTYRYEFIGQENLAEARKHSPSGQLIYALWHQNLVAGVLAHINQDILTMISRSKDGGLVIKVVSKLGYKIVRGSSSRGGKEAKAQMIEAIKKQKLDSSLTVDGPRGPLHKAKRGAASISYHTQSPIIPCSPIPMKFWEFKSWDKFRFPKPFSKVVLVYGEAISVCAQDAAEALSQTSLELENALKKGEILANSHFLTKK